MGGEEIVVVLPECEIENAVRRADAIRLAIEAGDVLHEGRRIGVTASIGAASYPRHGNDVQLLIHAADLALYDAKHDGRNCVRAAKQGANMQPAAVSAPDDAAGRA